MATPHKASPPEAGLWWGGSERLRGASRPTTSDFQIVLPATADNGDAREAEQSRPPKRASEPGSGTGVFWQAGVPISVQSG